MGKRIADRILLIGWDAADWQMLNPLIDAGKMPTLAKLIKGGVRGNLATIQPILSPLLWNSIATGKRADKHGIAGFVEPQPDRSGIRPVSSTSRTCKAIWNILTQSGLTSNVVSWFASHPAEPIRGSIVSDRYPAAVNCQDRSKAFPAGTFHPESLEQVLSPLLVSAAELPLDALLPFIPRAAEIDQQNDDRLIKLAGLLARASSVHAAACHLVQQDNWDFSAVYYAAIDEFGHSFMPYHPPRMAGISELDAAIYQDVMTGCYRFHDMMLDALLSYVGPETTVLLISDHGFHNAGLRPSTNACDQPVQWHREFGIASIQGPQIRQGETLYGATLLDITPTILAMFGLPIGADMDGRPWLEIFAQPTPAARINSWESVPGEAGMHSDAVREDPADAAEAMRQLIDLGYIEPPSDEVEDTIRRVLRDHKTNLAMALSSSRRAVRAATLWEVLIAEYPDEVGLRIQLATCYLNIGELEKCRHILQPLETATDHSPFVRLMLATIALKQNEPSTALRIVREVRQEKLQDPAILNRLGDLLMQLESWDEAESAFRDSLELLEDNPVSFNGLAKIFLERDEFDNATEQALLAVGLAHFFPAAHFHLASALYQLGREEEAIAAFETCLAMGFEPNAVHYHLSLLYRVRDPIKAREHEKQFSQL